MSRLWARFKQYWCIILIHAKNMSELSLNWKKLQSKIEKPKGKITKKSTTTKDVGAKLKKGSKSATIAKSKAVQTIAQEIVESEKKSSLEPKKGNGRQQDPGRYVSMDCEFVGVGFEGKESALARISIVNFHGHVLLDEFVKPKEKVVDWRTWVSGVTPKHMNNAITFEEAQQKACDILKSRVLVGHAIHHDLDSLFLSHPRSMIRDTSTFPTFREIALGRTPSLKKLTLHFLKIDIQGAQHSSVEDARATMSLYKLYKPQFEHFVRKQAFGKANSKN